MIKLIVNSQEYTNFNHINVSTSLTTISGSFSFTAFTESKQPFPFRVNDPCTISVDGKTVLTGFIEVLESSYDTNIHSIVFTGRSKTADVIDSTLGRGVEFNTSITLKEAIEKVLSLAEINGIDVIDQVKDIAPFDKSEALSAEVGTTVFDLIEKYCRKRQVLITSNGDGDIVLTRSGLEQERFTLLNTFVSSDRNNILSGSVSFDVTGRFFRYFVQSSGNASVETEPPLSDKELTDAFSTAIDEGDKDVGRIRTSRLSYMVAESSSTTGQCGPRAIWQANINRARSFKYEAIVQGFTNELTGNVWEPNFLVKVDDVFAGLSGQYLIESVSYNTTLDAGSTTTLSMVTPDAYKLIASEPLATKKTNRTGRQAAATLEEIAEVLAGLST